METKPLMMMTSDEILLLVDRILSKLNQGKKVETAALDRATNDKILPEYVIGWNGLAKLFGVTVNTAKARYETGALDAACKIVNGKLLTNAPLAIKLWSEHKSK